MGATSTLPCPNGTGGSNDGDTDSSNDGTSPHDPNSSPSSPQDSPQKSPPKNTPQSPAPAPAGGEDPNAKDPTPYGPLRPIEYGETGPNLMRDSKGQVFDVSQDPPKYVGDMTLGGVIRRKKGV